MKLELLIEKGGHHPHRDFRSEISSKWLYFYPYKDAFIRRFFNNDIEYLERKSKKELDQYEDWEDEFGDTKPVDEKAILLVDLRRGKSISVREAKEKMRKLRAGHMPYRKDDDYLYSLKSDDIGEYAQIAPGYWVDIVIEPDGTVVGYEDEIVKYIESEFNI